MKTLTKEDVLDYQLGCTTLSTGGGGVAPSLKAVERMVDEILDEGLPNRLPPPFCCTNHPLMSL